MGRSSDDVEDCFDLGGGGAFPFTRASLGSGLVVSMLMAVVVVPTRNVWRKDRRLDGAVVLVFDSECSSFVDDNGNDDDDESRIF